MISELSDKCNSKIFARMWMEVRIPKIPKTEKRLKTTSNIIK